MLFQNTQTWFLAPMCSSSLAPVTPTPGVSTSFLVPAHTHTCSHKCRQLTYLEICGHFAAAISLAHSVCTDTWTVKTPCCIHACKLAHRHMGGRGLHSWPSFNRAGQGHEVGVGWGPQEAEVSVAEPGSSWRGCPQAGGPTLSTHPPD